MLKVEVDGEAGIDRAARDLPDLVLVDLMTPGIDGLEVCRRLRADTRTASIPIIILTAKTSEWDRVAGLELGADDYVTRPFSPRELAARIKAVPRRTGRRIVLSNVVKSGELVIDLNRREVFCEDASIALTSSEFRLLHFLVSHPEQVFSRSELIDGALEREDSVSDRNVDVHVNGLRKKLGRYGERIETVRGFGYKFQ